MKAVTVNRTAVASSRPARPQPGVHLGAHIKRCSEMSAALVATSLLLVRVSYTLHARTGGDARPPCRGSAVQAPGTDCPPAVFTPRALQTPLSVAKLPDGVSSPSLSADQAPSYESIIKQRTGREEAVSDSMVPPPKVGRRGLGRGSGSGSFVT